MKLYRTLLACLLFVVSAFASADVLSVTMGTKNVITGGALKWQTGTVTLTAPAPAGGKIVEILDDTGWLQYSVYGILPYAARGYVKIPQGATTGTFSVSCYDLQYDDTLGTMTARDGSGVDAEVPITVRAMRITGINPIQSLARTGITQVYIKLNAPTRDDVTVDVWASNTGVVILGGDINGGAPVVIPAGDKYGWFFVYSSATATDTTFTAKVHFNQKGMTSPPIPMEDLKIVSVGLQNNFNTLQSGRGTEANIWLNAVNTLPFTMTLSSGNLINYPGTVTVEPYGGAVYFWISAGITKSVRGTNLKATAADGSYKSFDFKIVP